MFLAGLLASPLPAEDWPQWRGPQRDGVWNETGILQSFPAGGLPVRWRVPVAAGNSSPVVARGRVYVTDLLRNPDPRERVLCFEEATGKLLWTHAYERTPDDQEKDKGPDPKSAAFAAIDGPRQHPSSTKAKCTRWAAEATSSAWMR